MLLSPAVSAQTVVMGNTETAWPAAVAVGPTHVYVANSYDVISVFQHDGTFVKKIGTRGSSPGELSNPTGIAQGPDGFLYIGDSDNLRIIVLDTDGNLIRSFEGSFVYSQSRMEVRIGSDGEVYVLDGGTRKVKVFTPGGTLLRSFGNAGTLQGQFMTIRAMGLDASDNIYVADWIGPGSNGGRIQKFDKMGNFISVIQGEYSFSGLDVASDGKIVAPDSYWLKVWAFDQSGGSTSFGLQGQGGRQGEFNGAWGVDIAANGEIYIADVGNNRIQVFDANNTFVREFGAGIGAVGSLKYPTGADVDSDGNVYVAEAQNNRVQIFDPAGTSLATIGSYGFGDGLFNFAYNPQDVRVDDDGLIYIMDKSRIQVFTNTFSYSRSISSPGSGEDQLSSTLCMTFSGSNIMVADLPGTIKVFDRTTGAFIRSFGNTGSDEEKITYAYHLTSDDDGNAYVIDNVNAIKVYDPSGAFVRSMAIPAIRGLAWYDGKLYTCSGHSVLVYDTDGTFLGQYGTRGTDVNQFVYPTYLTVKDGYMLVTDISRVQKIELATLPFAAAQTVDFAALPTKTFGDESFEISATASSGLPVAFSSSDPDIASVNGNTVTIHNPGSVNITATQAGTPLFAPASKSQALVISKITPIITFELPETRRYGHPPIALEATSTADLPFVYQVIDGPAEIGGDNLYITGVGTITVTATQYGTSHYEPATPVQRTIEILKGEQVVTLGAFEPVVIGTLTSFRVVVENTAPVPIEVSSDNTEVATVQSFSVSIVGAGIATISAQAPETDFYLASNVATRTLMVTKQSQVIMFSTIPDMTMGDLPYVISAHATSQLGLILSTTSDKIQLDGATITPLHPGRVTIEANQPGNDIFTAAEPVEKSFCIRPMKPLISGNSSGIGSVVLTSNQASGNQWFKDFEPIEGATEQSYTATESGAYRVRATADDCVGEISDGHSVTINNPVTGDIKLHGDELTVFPTPANEEIFIERRSVQSSRVNIRLIDALGRIHYNDNGYTNTVYSINIRQLNHGVYFVFTESEGVIKRARVVKH